MWTQRRGLRTAPAVALIGALLAGCPESDTDRQPVTTTKPASPTEPAAPPSPPEQSDTPPENHHRVTVRIRSLADPQRGWLRIESIRDSAVGAWATGSFLQHDNKIVIETENVEQFSINLSKLRLNWNRRVVLRIDGRSSELMRKRRPVVHLRRSPAGSWDVVEP